MIYDCVVDSLELSEFQKRVGRDVFNSISLRDLSSPGPGGINVFLVAIIVAALTVKWDTAGARSKTTRAYHPNCRENDELFESLLEGFEYSDRIIKRCYQKIRRRYEDRSEEMLYGLGDGETLCRACHAKRHRERGDESIARLLRHTPN
ncbi:hypothetical protein [Halarchaeum nitratireducens]|uniref:Uncharacterized protein n=1 Tax=Halarchaeum nitratireducens TaxID=489913 RepID=A0A830GFS4_9EURY|nr:hypothetical protein [Halarchaeum nitratireducens]GGN23293.1 hypothetical protein GCM10009021_26090 [Halarchaeum nitratireducens]